MHGKSARHTSCLDLLHDSVSSFLSPTEHIYPLTLCVDTIVSTALSRRGLIFSESPTPLQNLIWEWHLGALLSSSSHRTSILQSSKTLSWNLSLSTHPTQPLSLFIATASNRWPYDLSKAPPMLTPICCFSDHCSGVPTPLQPSHCPPCFFGSPSGLFTAGSVSRLLTYGFASAKRAPPPFFGRWRQPNHVYRFFKGGVVTVRPALL